MERILSRGTPTQLGVETVSFHQGRDERTHEVFEWGLGVLDEPTLNRVRAQALCRTRAHMIVRILVDGARAVSVSNVA